MLSKKKNTQCYEWYVYNSIDDGAVWVRDIFCQSRIHLPACIKNILIMNVVEEMLVDLNNIARLTN